MNAHVISSPAPFAFDASRQPSPAQAAAAPRADAPSAGTYLDLTGRSVHLHAAARGPVTAWYFGVKPRRDATVIALGRQAWRDGAPASSAQAHAAALIERGVSVLLVDLRRAERPWSAWIGCTRERVVRAAVDYLEDRGYDTESTKVVHVE